MSAIAALPMFEDDTLTLKPDASLRRKLFGDEVLAHPAKQSLHQLMHLLRRYAVPGGVLLDPFGGAGSAMLATSAAHGGMYVVTMELAPHFIAMQQQAWTHFQKAMVSVTGDYMPLQGDSRKLAEILGSLPGADLPCADLVITSPSYGGSEAVDQRNIQNTTIEAHGGGNTAKLGYTLSGQTSRKTKTKTALHAYVPPVDLVVTSPPYMDALSDKRNQRDRRLQKAESSGDLLFSDSVRPNSQVSRVQSYNPPTVDLVVTSPPYQDTLSPEHRRRGHHWEKQEETTDIFLKMDTKAMSRAQGVMGYDESAENIGNQRGNKYLESMRQVWQQCALVTKPGAILCCITRDCVREGKRVPVGDQNRALLEQARFKVLEVERWHVAQLSFWRILQHRKNPDAPVIDVEEVSICRREVAA